MFPPKIFLQESLRRVDLKLWFRKKGKTVLFKITSSLACNEFFFLLLFMHCFHVYLLYKNSCELRHRIKKIKCVILDGQHSLTSFRLFSFVKYHIRINPKLLRVFISRSSSCSDRKLYFVRWKWTFIPKYQKTHYPFKSSGSYSTSSRRALEYANILITLKTATKRINWYLL